MLAGLTLFWPRGEAPRGLSGSMLQFTFPVQWTWPQGSTSADERMVRRQLRAPPKRPQFLYTNIGYQDLKVQARAPAPHAIIHCEPKNNVSEWVDLSTLSQDALRVAGGLLRELQELASPVLHLYTPRDVAENMELQDLDFRELYWETHDKSLPVDHPITWGQIEALERHGLTPITSLHLAPLLTPLHHEAVAFSRLQAHPEKFKRCAPRLPQVLHTMRVLESVTRPLRPQHDVRHYRSALENACGEQNDWRDPVYLFTLAEIDAQLYEVVNESYQEAMQYGENVPVVVYDLTHEGDKLRAWESANRTVLSLTQQIVRALKQLDQPC